MSESDFDISASIKWLPSFYEIVWQIFWVEVSKQNIQKIDTNKLIKDLLPKCGIFSMFLNLNKKVFFHEQFCFRLLTLFSKISILDVWLDSEYVLEQWSQEYQKQH